MTRTVLNTKITEAENKIAEADNSKSIITQKFNELILENVSARLEQTNLVSKTYFDNKLISFNRKITSNKTKCLEVLKQLNNQTTKDFFLGRMYFISTDGSQLLLDTLELKMSNALIMLLLGSQREYIFPNLSHYLLLFY